MASIPTQRLRFFRVCSFRLAFVFIVFSFFLPQHGSSQPAERSSGKSNLLAFIHGKVEVAVGDQAPWTLGRTNQILFPENRVRTGERSRAVIYLANGMTIHKSEFSEYEIPPSSGVTFKRGLFQILNRLKSSSEFKLPGANGAIRGTDFLVKVEGADAQVIVLDGEVSLTNANGGVVLNNKEMAVIENGGAPRKTAVVEAVNNLIQWFLYYPGVLNVDELSFTAAEAGAAGDSIQAYRAGDLLAADQTFPWQSPPGSDSERALRASLLLNAGQVEKARAVIQNSASPAARAINKLISAIKFQVAADTNPPVTSSEWLAESYYLQSRLELREALMAARAATTNAPGFGLAWARVAELEFGFGRTERALEALEKSLQLSPRNAQAIALSGFLLAAKNRTAAALSEFDRAIEIDGALGNAWLGRGLCLIHQGRNDEGLRDLHIAAALEPQRSILRSYLGKAFATVGDDKHARRELTVARELDPNDPTSWLYSALLNQQSNRINEAISDLERSQELNDNRRLFRSTQLLDQDRAVRSANLANIYLDAGMKEVSVREAASGVNYDYANYSAHLFLADSYDALRDPTRFNLRYETVWFNELLLANILAPVGGARLSQGVSAQEYSRLFESDELSLANSVVARTDGIVHDRASQFGTMGKTSYALDLDYQHHDGVRPNNELESIEWYSTVKQQVTAQDSALVLVKYEDYHSGDNFQYYDPRNVRRNFSFDEKQEPILVGAWHHEWSPGMHTMFLGGRLINEQHFVDRKVPEIVLFEDAAGTVDARASTGVDVDYHSRFEIYSAELNQICDWRWVTLSAGARYQAGTFNTKNRLDNPTSIAFLLDNPPASGSVEDDFERITGYGYVILKPLPQLRLTGGLAYDQETIPRNFRHPPVGPGEDERSHVGPKAAINWTPFTNANINATVRGIYTRSLGGVSLDESYRLEPTQLAGFPQAFRSVISESLVGSVSAPTYETFGLALDLKFGSRTYAGIQAEKITSEVRRRIGVLTLQNGIPPASPDSVGERLDYDERTLAVSLNQLLGDGLVAGATYRLTCAELEDNYRGVPASVLATANPSQRATLHRASGYLLYNHFSGFFARAELHWYAQQNFDYSPDLPGDDFFQENIYIGYRFARHRGEVRLGILNLSGEDYRLNPLTTYGELPRERVFEARLSFRF